MKWNDNEIESMINLFKRGLTLIEVSNELGRTKKSVYVKLSNIGYNISDFSEHIYYENKICVNCKGEYNALKINKRQFCSKSCAVSYNNKNRTLSDVTKNKISKKLTKKVKENKISKKITKKVKENKVCYNCKVNYVNEYKKRICNECRYKYYKIYRPSCEFKFNVYDYENKFNLDIILDLGWYSPKNKNNNLGGVSKDHLYSVSDGFKNGVSPEIISHPANCQLLVHTDNIKKYNRSVISLEELYNRIKNW